jgi:ABC-2 type transport system permease protein
MRMARIPGLAAFGLFIGFLAPSENVMQVVGPVLAILALFGGLFVPLQFLPQVMQTIAKYTPAYGVGQMARAPLVGGFHLTALVNVIAWALFFALAAMQLFRRDTARV